MQRGKVGYNSSLPTSFSTIAIRDEVWVKGFFFMVPHEEYETYISPFDDDIIRAPFSLHLQQHILLHYDDAHLHGCTYYVHLSHLKTHDFPSSLVSRFEVGGTSSNTWANRYMIKKILLEKISFIIS